MAEKTRPAGAEGSSRLNGIVPLARYIFSRAPRQTLIALAFLLLGSLTEGVSVLLLVPIIRLIDVSGRITAIDVPTGPLQPWLGATLSFDLRLALAAFVVLVAARATLMRYKDIYNTALINDFINRLRNDLFASVAEARWSFLARLRGSDINHALTADIDRVQTAAAQLLQLLQTIVVVAAYMVVAVTISPRMTLFATLIGALALGLLAPIRRIASRHGNTLTDQRREQYRIISEFVGGVKVAKSTNTEPLYVAQLATTLAAMRESILRFVRLHSLGALSFQTVSAAGLALFVYVALVHFAIDRSAIIVLLFLFLRMSPRLAAIQGAVQNILTNLPALDAMLSMQRACAREAEPPLFAGPAMAITREVELRHVDFAYSGDGPAVLHDVSFMIPAGAVTAIIGPSGSGKSTIADILMGLLEPTSGTMLIDGQALDAASRRALRRTLAYVPQESFLLHDTIEANLRFGQLAGDEQALWEALEAANAADFVRAQPSGLQTVVGDRGLRLSGGERQRIALARALLRKPNLLLLDEATSALDWRSQNAIATAIRGLRGTMTIVTIAHRPSMIAFADWVVTIDHGRVSATGEYATLTEQQDSYLHSVMEQDR